LINDEGGRQHPNLSKAGKWVLAVAEDWIGNTQLGDKLPDFVDVRIFESHSPNFGSNSVILVKKCLLVQGGPMTQAEIETFESSQYHQSAIQVRRYDDDGKVAGLEIKPVQNYREMLQSQLLD